MNFRKTLLLSLVLLLLCAAAGLCLGSTPLSPGQLWAAVTGAGDETVRVILWKLRFPRVLAGILAGIGLSASGVLLQSVTANALASPNIIGVNSGAGLGVILLLSFFPAAGRLTPFAAFFGAFAAALIILTAANRLSGSRLTVLLIGIAVTTVFNAAISLLSLLDEEVLAQYNHFTVGSLKAVQLRDLWIPGGLIAGAFAAAMVLAQRIGVLCLGDQAAAALGIRVRETRIAAMACAAASAAATVSFAGLLGFVGLVVPHMARRLVGASPRKLLPTAAMLGAILVVLADLLGRTLFAPSELPVGILMSLVGAPYFLILLCRRKAYDRIS